MKKDASLNMQYVIIFIIGIYFFSFLFLKIFFRKLKIPTFESLQSSSKKCSQVSKAFNANAKKTWWAR
jgi:hypothetical protein